MEQKATSAIKKVVVGIVVAILVAAAGYFGLNVNEKVITDTVSGIADSVVETPEVTPAQ